MAVTRTVSWRAREAISLAPRLQPGDRKPELDQEPFLTVFVGADLGETVGNGSGIILGTWPPG